jgi:hypothetical protein
MADHDTEEAVLLFATDEHDVSLRMKLTTTQKSGTGKI